jgi:hypothetical protein
VRRRPIDCQRIDYYRKGRTLAPPTETEPSTARRPTLDTQTTFVNLLLYGDPGSGKTTGATGLARAGRLVYVDAENGLKRQPLETLGLPTENIQVYRPATFAGLEELAGELRAELTHDPDAYVGVVLDSLSEIQRALIEEDARGRYRLTQGDYGENTQKLRRGLRLYRDLPCHVGFTAHVRRDEDDDGEVHFGPALTPAVAGDLLGLVDVVCHTHAIARLDGQEPDYLGAFRPGRKFVAKDRFGLLPPRLINPTFDRVVAYVEGDYRREALREVDAGVTDPQGLDREQYEYRLRMAAVGTHERKD